jgi:hypothetical protein
MKEAATRLHGGFLRALLSNPEDGGNTFFQNVGCLSTDYTTLYPRWSVVSEPPLREPQTLFLNKYLYLLGKAVPVYIQLSTMPWRHMGEWRHSSRILDLGTWRRWVVRFTSRPFYPPAPFGYKAVLASKLVWMLWRREKSYAPVENRTATVHPVERRCTVWVILTPSTNIVLYS